MRQGTYKWRGMVVLWRHKERSKEGAETEHRRFPLSVFLLGVLFMHEYYQSKIALNRAMQRLQATAKYNR